MKHRIILALLLILLACKNENKAPLQNDNPSFKLFNELWEVFDKNYAFFELRGVDWKAEKEAQIPIISKMNNDTLLFDHFCDLLKKFDDTHINLESDQMNRYCNSGALPAFLKEFPSNEAFSAFLKARDNTLSEIGFNKMEDSDSKIFQYALNQTQGWGYLRIKRFYGASLEEIRAELDQIMPLLKKVKQLIIDIRANPGGNDETALLIAGYFFQDREIAFIKTRRNGPAYEDFSQPDTTFLEPASSPNIDYDNIYLLTNRAAGSSADVYALVMSYLPNITLLGRNTEGIFSNMYRTTLSNDWRITLSNERYYSREMICYEKIGVPVDMVLDNKMEDVEKGIDILIKEIIN